MLYRKVVGTFGGSYKKKWAVLTSNALHFYNGKVAKYIPFYTIQCNSIQFNTVPYHNLITILTGFLDEHSAKAARESDTLPTDDKDIISVLHCGFFGLLLAVFVSGCLGGCRWLPSA